MPIRFRSLYRRTPAVPGAEVLFPVAAEAMRSLASSAQGAAASTEQMSSAIGMSEVDFSNRIEDLHAFVEQMQREVFHSIGIPERLAGGPLYGRHSPVFTDTPVITPSPAPKPKTISPFSIGLGQRSIEV